jgi:hypothetical protein
MDLKAVTTATAHNEMFGDCELYDTVAALVCGGRGELKSTKRFLICEGLTDAFNDVFQFSSKTLKNNRHVIAAATFDSSAERL